MLTARGEEIDRVLGLELSPMTIYQNHLTIENWLLVFKAILRRATPAERKYTKLGPYFIRRKFTLEFCGLVLHSGLQQASYSVQDLGLNWL